MRALKPLGYHIDHRVGEVLHVDLKHVETLIKNGDAEIVVNNFGNNVEYDQHLVSGSLYPEWVTAEDINRGVESVSPPIKEEE
jgi:hypothetical protein